VRRNPFSATFGVSPPLLVGRDGLLDEFGDALDDGPGAAARATLYTGARGAGKTVMLNAAEDVARERGWLAVSETATAGLVERLVTQALPRMLADHESEPDRRRVTGLTVPVVSGGVSCDSQSKHPVRAAGYETRSRPSPTFWAGTAPGC
jgi:hypothetical protein